jgi:hypothetical protein
VFPKEIDVVLNTVLSATALTRDVSLSSHRGLVLFERGPHTTLHTHLLRLAYMAADAAFNASIVPILVAAF